MVESVDTQDLKSCEHKSSCGFESRPEHINSSQFGAVRVGKLPHPSLPKKFYIIHAEVAQLVEHNLAKVGVAGSSLVFRSVFFPFSSV